MDLFRKLLAIVSAALPLPAFTDKAAVDAWLDRLSEPLADLIASIAAELQAEGFVDIELPTGGVATIVVGQDGVLGMAEGQQLQLAQALSVDESGMPRVGGKWLDLFMKLLPFILQILPFFLEPDPDPSPEPEPPVV